MSSPTPIHPPQPAELLSRNPPVLTRPLALLDGQAYAAAWPFARQPITRWDPATLKHVPVDPPAFSLQQDLLIVRQDGAAFGPGGDHPLDELPLSPALPFVPPSTRLWSPDGLQAYRTGHRADPLSVFSRLCAAFDAFVDFDRSLAPQGAMCELLSCFVLSTWLSAAFPVIGYLWLTGDGGDNQARLFHAVLRLGFLAAPAGPAEAPVLRSLAEYGALLAHDLTLNPDRPSRLNPTERPAILAGARRGLAHPVREYDNRRQSWTLRLASSYCPRLFSALGPPDPVLLPLCLVVPVVRTADSRRASLDPLEPAAWPFDLAALHDDLWAFGLAHLAPLRDRTTSMGPCASLASPTLSPWHAILAIAAWLDSHGIPGLSDRLCEVARSYLDEGWHLDPSDLTPLIVRGLAARCAGLLVPNRVGVLESIDVTTRDVISAAQLLIEADSPIRYADLTPQRVGRLLARLRVPRAHRNRASNARLWRLTAHDLRRLCTVYGIALPSPPAIP